MYGIWLFFAFQENSNEEKFPFYNEKLNQNHNQNPVVEKDEPPKYADQKVVKDAFGESDIEDKQEQQNIEQPQILVNTKYDQISSSNYNYRMT